VARSAGAHRPRRRRSCARAAAVAQDRPPVAPLMTQSNGPTRSSSRSSSHGCSSCHPQSSIPTSRRRPPLPRRTSREPRRWSRSASVSAIASWTRNPARHRITIRPRSRRPWAPSPAARITAMISSTFGGSAGSADLCSAAGDPPGIPESSPANGAGRHDRAACSDSRRVGRDDWTRLAADFHEAETRRRPLARRTFVDSPSSHRPMTRRYRLHALPHQAVPCT
jgi:hypothetical protein